MKEPRRTAPGAGPGAVLLETLDAIHRLDRERGSATLATLGRRIAAGDASVNERVLALQGLGLVTVEEPGRLVLTAAGERVAVGLVRKHRLLERFLADALKLPWERVHDEACRLTPVLSDDVADGLATLLGNPATCPHGNPIPSSDDRSLRDAGTALHRVRPGQAGVIVRIEREEPEVLRYLAALGLVPGTRVDVEEVAPFGGPLLVRVGSARYALGRKVASHVRVREP